MTPAVVNQAALLARVDRVQQSVLDAARVARLVLADLTDVPVIAVSLVPTVRGTFRVDVQVPTLAGLEVCIARFGGERQVETSGDSSYVAEHTSVDVRVDGVAVRLAWCRFLDDAEAAAWRAAQDATVGGGAR